jgi:hypothetical protein
MQAQFVVAEANDPLEHEADRVADQVMRMHHQEIHPEISISPVSQLRRKCATCEEEDRTHVQAKPAGVVTTTRSEAPAVAGNVLRSAGQPLDPVVRVFMEPRFGHDFSKVRIHIDAAAAASARAANAFAYTVGQHIVFASGQYAPSTSAGRRLLAHELTHTLQQRPLEVSLPDAASVPQYGGQVGEETDMLDQGHFSPLKRLTLVKVFRQKLEPTEPPPKVERDIELPPHVIPMNAPAVKEAETCEQMPGGDTNCEVNQNTGIPTGKVLHSVSEINPCIRPCVEQHEAVHVRQLKTFCPQLRDCYLAADKGKRPIEECVKMAIFGNAERECAAYNVSAPCVERRLKTAKECQSSANKEYGRRKLESERCFRDKYCARPVAK